MSLASDAAAELNPLAPPRGPLVLGIISLLAGALGWWASLRLFLDYIASLKDSNFVASCNLSDTVSCAQNIESSYGSILGFSNTVLGLTLFVVPIVMGVLILARVSLPRWVYAGYSIGTGAAVVLISYLQWASFTQIGTLCVYCLLIWSVTIPLFWSSLSRTLSRPVSGDTAPRASLIGGLRTAVVESWWIFAVVHLIAVLAFGELSIGAMSELIQVIFG